MPTAREEMSRDLLTVEATLPLAQVAERMVAREVGAVLVLDGERLEGIMTERDVLRAVARGIRDDAVVRDWMTTEPETDETLEHAATLMMHGGFRHLPVVEGGHVVGMLSIRDLMRIALADSAPRGV